MGLQPPITRSQNLSVLKQIGNLSCAAAVASSKSGKWTPPQLPQEMVVFNRNSSTISLCARFHNQIFDTCQNFWKKTRIKRTI